MSETEQDTVLDAEFEAEIDQKMGVTVNGTIIVRGPDGEDLELEGEAANAFIEERTKHLLMTAKTNHKRKKKIVGPGGLDEFTFGVIMQGQFAQFVADAIFPPGTVERLSFDIAWEEAQKPIIEQLLSEIAKRRLDAGGGLIVPGGR